MSRFLPLVFVAVALSPAGAEPARKTRLPSEALHDIVKGRMADQKRSPEEIEAAYKPLLVGVRTRGLSPTEEVALGMAYYFTFDGLSAKPLLERHAGRNDRVGRVASQALQQMAFFGAHDIALVERQLAEFRRRFRPAREDLEHTSVAVANLVRQRVTDGDHAGAVRLIVDDVAALPLDLPFRGFDNLGRFFESFRKAGRDDIALSLLEKHRDAMRVRVAAWSRSSARVAPEASLAYAHRRGVVHLQPFDDWLLEDDPKFSRDEATLAASARAVEKLGRWIEAVRAGKPIPLR